MRSTVCIYGSPWRSRLFRLTASLVPGHVFSRRVKLGGRLISSHENTSKDAQKHAQTENNLKAAAAVSVSGYGFSVSAEASHETAEATDKSEKAQSFASNMSWEATGGNTVLCNE